MMDRAPITLSTICLLIVGVESICLGGENFHCSDPELVQVAEQARRVSARFWSGGDLPANWSHPCPIEVTFSPQPGHGKTGFRFENGEVFGWRMQVSGSRDSLINDVVPHEVDHMVRASLIRHPVERWLDEGCASLMESPSSHQRLRQIARELNDEFPTLHWLEGMSYPQSAEELEQLYAGGFSLVEFLLSRGTPAQLLEFQREVGSVATRLLRHYQLTPESLRSEWQLWRRTAGGIDCVQDRCPVYDRSLPRAQLPVLTIWTASWCGPCQQFHSDYKSNPIFRDQLHSRFRIEYQEFERNPALAHRLGIRTLPTFLARNIRIEGYSTPDRLIQELGLSEAIPANFSAPPSLSSPDPSEEQSNEPAEQSHPPGLASPVLLEGEAPGLLPPIETISSLATSPPLLPWGMLLGGGIATGGVGGVALSLFAVALRHRFRQRRLDVSGRGNERRGTELPAPFPRELDEASQLLAIRQSEGRVAVLDTLRGLFLDDELRRFESSNDPQQSQLARELRESIDTRVAEVAPLTTCVPSH